MEIENSYEKLAAMLEPGSIVQHFVDFEPDIPVSDFLQPTKMAAADYFSIFDADRKDVLNKQLMDLLKSIGSARRQDQAEKDAADLSAVLTAPEMEKLAALAPSMNPFREAKRYSDMGTADGYAQKANILRELIRANPDQWRVDDDTNPHVVGLTHTSGWRYHLPRWAVQDLGIGRPNTVKTDGSPVTIT